MKFYYALALYLISTCSLLAQMEVPLTHNAVLEQAHAEWQKTTMEKWFGEDYTNLKSNTDCTEPEVSINYLTAGESISFLIDTFDLDGMNGTLICLNCEEQNFGTASMDGIELSYVSNSNTEAGIDTVLVEFCTANNETCFIFDYTILVKREGESRIDPLITLTPSEHIFYSIDTENLPGNFVCATPYDCNENYEGEPYMWISSSKPNEFFYEASLYRGMDSVCFVLCDDFTICDTVIVPFNITQANPTLTPPLMDDFSYAGPYPDTAMWLDRRVYVNTDFSTNPVSIGMATFDGLNPNGRPYGGGFGKSDRLTSTYINLEGQGSLFISFWLQQEGLGDRPEEDDTMQLEFKNSDGDWVNIALFSGVSDTIPLSERPDWKFYAYPITQNYLHDDFQFRFSNLSSRTGVLDIWNLDYVRLAANADNPVVNDVALVQPPSYILKNYTSMPWSHFDANRSAEVVDKLAISFYNHDNENLPIQDSELKISEVVTNTNNVLDITLSDDAVNIETASYLFQDRNVGVFFPNDDFNNEEVLEFVTEYNIVQNSQDNTGTIRQNDKFSRSTHFANYFAHDDGTAESNIVAQNFANQSVEIAVKFTANIDDFLHAFQMHIPHVTNNVNSQLFNFKVWIGGETPDDTPEYEMDLIRPEYLDDYRGDSLQGYTTYPLLNSMGEADTLFIPAGNFFIGWEQVVPCQGTNCLPVGYDKNTPEAAVFNFRNRNGEGWEPFPIAIPDGAVMIRPIVGMDRPGPTNTTNISQSINPIRIFPNPASYQLQLQLTAGDYQDYELAVFNNTGQLLQQMPLIESLDTSTYQNGIYFLKITNLRTKTISNHKVVVVK